VSYLKASGAPRISDISAGFAHNVRPHSPCDWPPPGGRGTREVQAVAALYVDRRGPYPKLPGVDCWDAGRDARRYAGPWPVVAHPPCTHYGRVRHLGKVQDSDCAPIAVEQVRRFGGVLEHPAHSKLWEHCGLPLPGAPTGLFWDYTVEVDQVEWGHACRKRTWLYLVGVPREALERPPFPGRMPTHWCSGGRTKSSRSGSPIPPGIKAASAQIKRRTPPLFAEYLIRLARAAGAARRAA
jgi:hypothetical protein